MRRLGVFAVLLVRIGSLMRRVCVLATLAVLLLPFGGTGTRPLPLHALAPATAPLTGLVYELGAYRLVELDPATLGAVRSSAPLSYGWGWARSPDGKLLVLGTGEPKSYETTALQIADPSTLEAVGKPIQIGGVLRAALWSVPNEVFAVVEAGSTARLQVIDVASRRIVSGTPIDGTVASSSRFEHGLVLLLQRSGAIGPARLAVVYPDGQLRTVAVPRIRVGNVWNGSTGKVRQPALAVDDAGGAAYLIDPDGLVAVVDLRTLVVRYHRPARTLLSRLDAWLTPAAEAKGMNGPMRSARWLGDGLIAVWGTNQSDVRRKGVRVVSGTPSGLRILDTRSWTTRMIDAGSDQAVVGDGVLLTTGTAWSSSRSYSRKGSGVAAYDVRGSLRWRAFPQTSAWIAAVYGSVAVISRPSGKLYDVVDLQTGKMVRESVDGPIPTLLLGEGT